jgi:hypothetical protein
MAFTQAQLTAIREAYANGATEVSLPDGSRVRYRSLDEMQRVIADIESSLGIRAPNKNVVYPSHRRGF